MNGTDEFKNIPPTIHEKDTTPEIGRKLSESLAGSIAKTQQSLNVADMDRAIDAVAKARQIYLYGIGGSAVIALAAHHLFTKAGLNCVVYTDGYMFWRVRTGNLTGPANSTMEPYDTKMLSDEQVWQVITYLRSLD